MHATAGVEYKEGWNNNATKMQTNVWQTSKPSA